MRRDLIALPDNSRVWVYQAKKRIPEKQAENIKKDLYDFSMKWQSHGTELDSYGHLFHSQFIVLVADSSNLPSGCSIDSSVHFIEDIGNKYGLDFFDRLTFTYMQDNKVYSLASAELGPKYSSQQINDDTLMFDNLVATKADFITDWLKPLSSSWHKKFL